MKKRRRLHDDRQPDTRHATTKQLLVQLKAQAAGILSEGVVLSSFKHKGLSGIEREEPIRRFLRTHLPGRFLVGQGAIASSEVILEHQHDIIVADRDVCFMLLNTLSAQLLATESVHLIVEVRSRANNMKDVARSFAAVRRLHPSEGIRRPALHTLVIYQGPKQERTLIDRLRKLNADHSDKGKRMAIDCILVLAATGSQDPSTGYLIGYGRIDENKRKLWHHYYPEVGQEGLIGPKVIQRGVGAFAFWYAAILNHLNGVKAFPPFLYSYLGRKVTIIPESE
jgi:hypothetical protein